MLDAPRVVPDFDLPGIDGEHHQLIDSRGSVTLVNIWAVWCTPCRREMPSLERLHRQLGGEGLRVIAVHMGTSLDSAAMVEAILQLISG